MIERLYSEKKLAENLGVTRDDLRHARKTTLQKGKHFQELDRAIVLTDSGIARLVEYWRATGLQVAIEPAALEASMVGDNGAEDPTEPHQGLGLITLRVTRIFGNKRLLEARYDVQPADNRRVTVSVVNNKNFVPNMGIQALPAAPGSSFFQLVGRCPRRKGKF